jgi:hypothetical protein
MAKVYADQGNLLKAAEIYRYLLKSEPEQINLKDALAEIEMKLNEKSSEDLIRLFNRWIDLLLTHQNMQKLIKFRNYLRDSQWMVPVHEVCFPVSLWRLRGWSFQILSSGGIPTPSAFSRKKPAGAAVSPTAKPLKWRSHSVDIVQRGINPENTNSEWFGEFLVSIQKYGFLFKIKTCEKNNHPVEVPGQAGI